MNYGELLSKHNEFMEKEERAFFYDVTRRSVKNAKTAKEKAEGILVILYIWNKGAYTRGKKRIKFDKKHVNDFVDLIKSTESDLKLLDNSTLNKIEFEANINNNKVLDIIKDLYTTFANLVKPTGASKALHLLNPELFMMWDTYIRNNKTYSCWNANAKNYIKFMKKSKEIINEIIISYSNEFSCVESESKKRITEKCNNYTMVKLLDEYNFVVFSLPNLKK